MKPLYKIEYYVEWMGKWAQEVYKDKEEFNLLEAGEVMAIFKKVDLQWLLDYDYRLVLV